MCTIILWVVVIKYYGRPMPRGSKPQLSNAHEQELNAASVPAGSTPEAEVTPTVPNFRKGLIRDSQFEVLIGIGEGEYRQMIESLLEDLQLGLESHRAEQMGETSWRMRRASVTTWRSRTSKRRVRTWRRRCDPPSPSKRWNPSSASTNRGRPRYLRKRRYLGAESKKFQKMYVYDKE